jgi:uncharacterized membrane protein
MLAVQFYDAVVAVHVLAVVAAFGVSFAYPVMVSSAVRAHPRSLPYLHEVQSRLGRFLIAPGVVVILIAGEYLAAEGPYSHDLTWVNAGQVIAVLLLIMGFAVFAPLERKLSTLAKRDVAAAGPSGEVVLGADYLSTLTKVKIAGITSSLLVVTAITLMVTKP